MQKIAGVADSDAARYGSKDEWIRLVANCRRKQSFAFVGPTFLVPLPLPCTPCIDVFSVPPASLVTTD